MGDSIVTQCSIKISSGGHNLISVDEFASYSYEKRMQLISGKSVTFLNDAGDIVPLVEGVKFVANLLRNKPVEK